MKISKILKFSLITSTIITFNACGGGSNGGETSTSGLTQITTVDDAKNNFQALSAMDSLNGTSNSLNNKTSKYNKTNSANCNNGGSISVTEEGSNMNIVANNCKNGSYYMNGNFTITESSNGTEKIIMSNITIKDQEIEFSSKNLTLVTNDSEHWSKMDGDMYITSKCFSGKYNLETIQKIYDAQDGSDNEESGIVKLNGATYIFNNPYVTIKIGDKEETILQSELEKQMNKTTTCLG